MATAILSWRSLLWRLFDSYRLRKFRSQRAAYKAAAVSSDGLGAEARELIQAGLFRAAVFTARLWLEHELSELSSGMPGWNGSYMGRGHVPLLLANGRITKRQANRVQLVYSRASKV